MSNPFISKEPTLEDYWRAIILFGRNVASYKFALAKSLLSLKPEAGQLIKLSDLAVPFSSYLAEHLSHSPKQITSASSKYLDACKKYGIDEPNQNRLIEETVKLGFNNVIDAFHIVGSGEVAKKFYIDERVKSDGIRITEEFSALMERIQFANLSTEVESRWNLVETAWGLGISSNLIEVKHDNNEGVLFTLDSKKQRKTITSCRGALNGYQKGKCFYCFTNILARDGSDTEVDHFFPFMLQKDSSFQLINGIWNLVLACPHCNAGEGGKHQKIPSIALLERLFRRNEFLIASHHPLRETLMNQTGSDLTSRRRYLNDYYNKAISKLLHTWEPAKRDVECF